MKFKEDLKTKRSRAKIILKKLEYLYPYAKCHLRFSNAFELLIGCILSAQCTDKRVNEVTKELFKKYRDPGDFSKAVIQDLEMEIRSTGFYKAKSKSIINACKTVVDNFQGEFPKTMAELVTLDGVGRKTANVVLGNYYGIPGIIVDTHIKRLSSRLKLSEKSDPARIEFEIMELIPKKKWTFFSNALGDHGRTVCKSRKPNCNECKISGLCPSKEIFV